MKNKDIIDAIGGIDYDMVEDAAIRKRGVIGKRSAIILISAVISLIAVASVVIGLNYKKDPPPVSSDIDVTGGTEEETGTIGPNSSDTEVTSVWFTQAIDPSLIAPKEFFSFESFEAYEKGKDEDFSRYYYIPTALGDDYELYKILRQEKNSVYSYEYIDVKYKLKGADIKEDSLIDIRTKLISCEYSVDEYSQTAFENYIDNGFEEFNYNGRKIYKIDNYTVDESTLLSYRVIFLEEGHLIGMFIPAIDTFENMMRYTDVVRVEID